MGLKWQRYPNMQSPSHLLYLKQIASAWLPAWELLFLKGVSCPLILLVCFVPVEFASPPGCTSSLRRHSQVLCMCHTSLCYEPSLWNSGHTNLGRSLTSQFDQLPLLLYNSFYHISQHGWNSVSKLRCHHTGIVANHYIQVVISGIKYFCGLARSVDWTSHTFPVATKAGSFAGGSSTRSIYSHTSILFLVWLEVHTPPEPPLRDPFC